MSPGDIVALIIVLFFVIGVIVGCIAVVALSAIRRDRALASGKSDPSVLQDGDDPDDYRTGAAGVAGHWDGITSDGTTPNDRPRWPGDTDTGGTS
jgi:hypothetical protein